jgi:nitrate/TMAO reductase-like tetraheme cytochrome c subunit
MKASIVQLALLVLLCVNASLVNAAPLTVDGHDITNFPLTGKHRQTPCESCHKNSTLFVGAPRDCASCHPDSRHQGRLVQPTPMVCESCHTTASWRGATIDHNKATTFLLQGPHANKPCASCHGADGTKLNNVTNAITCASCHVSKKHGTAFGTDCLRCHSKESFDKPMFNHSATDFPLERRHAVIACIDCHKASKPIPSPGTCIGCHKNPHRGGTSYACNDCHKSDRWRIIRFDHDQTDFALTGRHALTQCVSCHKSRNWIGLSATCFSCHSKRRPRTDEHLSSDSASCESCHISSSWRIIRR